MEQAVNEHIVPVRGWRLRVLEAGAGDPIVLVHGLGTSSAYWRHNIRALAACGRVLAVDLPGFGKSDTPDGILRPEDLADVLYMWCEQLGIERATFLGHSMGGEVCLWLAAKHPQLVDRLVLAGSTGAPDCAPLWRRMAKLAHDGLREPFSFLPVLMRAYWQAGPWRMIQTARASNPARLERHLGEVQAETLVLWGANDPVIPVDEALCLSRRLPNARLVVVADGAHGLIFDAPDAFNRAVCDFLGPATVPLVTMARTADQKAADPAGPAA
jgi:pimeloyl-ACP methyl ester carboxylesterase